MALRKDVEILCSVTVGSLPRSLFHVEYDFRHYSQNNSWGPLWQPSSLVDKQWCFVCWAQTHICDIRTHARWVNNTFITGIRSSDEAERALTCVKQQDIFHISPWTNKARGPPAPLCWLEAFSEGLCDQASDAHTSSLEAETWNLSRGTEAGGGGGGEGRRSHEIEPH